MPTPQNVVFFESPGELRSWFKANHESVAELWVGQHRKRTGRPSVTWTELVDQCLCFGWIDGVRHSLDNESFAQRVTPRRKGSNWSAVNIKRFGELDKAGLAHAKGRAAFAAREEGRSASVALTKRWRRNSASIPQPGNSLSRRLPGIAGLRHIGPSARSARRPVPNDCVS
jgi:uncharacterized protein YdeI (YjbR/CyaY-like superfamily)